MPTYLTPPPHPLPFRAGFMRTGIPPPPGGMDFQGNSEPPALPGGGGAVKIFESILWPVLAWLTA